MAKGASVDAANLDVGQASDWPAGNNLERFAQKPGVSNPRAVSRPGTSVRSPNDATSRKARWPGLPVKDICRQWPVMLGKMRIGSHLHVSPQVQRADSVRSVAVCIAPAAALRESSSFGSVRYALA